MPHTVKHEVDQAQFRPRPPVVRPKHNPPDWPGEQGKAVVIPPDKQDNMKEMFKINQFNLMASDMISLNRSLPDVRLEGYVYSGFHILLHFFPLLVSMI